MSATIKMVLEGLPERIQELADTLDRAFPEAIDWSVVAKLGRDHTMRLEGVALLHHEALRPPGRIRLSPSIAQAWKLSSSAAREVNQLGASPCGNLQP